MSAVHVYLDVDGVLNAFPSSADPGWGWGDSEIVRVNGFPICYSPAMVDALNDLAERVTFHWLTTWRADAPALLAPAIGLRGEAWPVLDAPEMYGGKWDWWKLRAIRDHVESTQPEHAFWIDDDIRFDTRANDWLNLPSVGVVPICPRSSIGLTRDAFDLLAEVHP